MATQEKIEKMLIKSEVILSAGKISYANYLESKRKEILSKPYIMFPFVYKGKITYIGAIWLVINFFL